MKKNGRKKVKRKPAKKHPKSRVVKILGRLGFLFAIGVVVVIGLIFYKQQYDISHDLSVIGNGTPTVVQIHDANCRLCQQLRRNVGSVDGQFEARVQFRIADLGTISGRRLAQKHRVEHVTLLLFNGSGERVGVIRGVRSGEELLPAFKRLAVRAPVKSSLPSTNPSG